MPWGSRNQLAFQKNGADTAIRLAVSVLFPRLIFQREQLYLHQILDACEWIDEIPIVALDDPAKPRPKRLSWKYPLNDAIVWPERGVCGVLCVVFRVLCVCVSVSVSVCL